MPKTIVVLPTYNEIENLPLIVRALFDLAIDDLNILVVDDNSPDGTGRLADRLAADTYPGRLFVLHRTEKAGLGPAYIAGFKKALSLGADYIIQMDADFSHQPKYIPDLLKAAETHDLVIASRFVKGGSVDETWSFYRKLLSWFANRIYTPLILGIQVYDATGGYRIWRRQTLIGLDLDRIRSNGYIFQVEMAYVASRLGFRVGEIPIYFPDRKLGQSKMDIRIQLEAALRVWQVMARHRNLNPQNRRTKAYTV
ncbi:MAG: polyprenol monophosphomannose synthase [Chloroflexi bacterium]|nr:polyprenol monophosphomannose synthase [Chloroflexota bacterium]